MLAATNPPSAGRIVKSQACCFVIAVVLGVSVRIARDVHVEENNPLSQSAGPYRRYTLAISLVCFVCTSAFPQLNVRIRHLTQRRASKKKGLTNEERLD